LWQALKRKVKVKVGTRVSLWLPPPIALPPRHILWQALIHSLSFFICWMLMEEGKGVLVSMTALLLLLKSTPCQQHPDLADLQEIDTQ
jgi:hypothetical protein